MAALILWLCHTHPLPAEQKGGSFTICSNEHMGKGVLFYCFTHKWAQESVIAPPSPHPPNNYDAVQGLANVSAQIVNISDSVGWMFSVATTQLCWGSKKAKDDRSTNGPGCVPIKLYSQKEAVAGFGRWGRCRLPTPELVVGDSGLEVRRHRLILYLNPSCRVTSDNSFVVLNLCLLEGNFSDNRNLEPYSWRAVGTQKVV